MVFDKYPKAAARRKPPQEVNIQVFVKNYYDRVTTASSAPAEEYLLLDYSPTGPFAVQI